MSSVFIDCRCHPMSCNGRTPRACCRCSRLCGYLWWGYKVLASICTALVLLAVALALSAPAIMALMEAFIHCGANLGCYSTICKSVMACAEADFPPSPECMQRQFFHAVPSTGFSEENILSVCGLDILNRSCFKERAAPIFLEILNLV